MDHPLNWYQLMVSCGISCEVREFGVSGCRQGTKLLKDIILLGTGCKAMSHVVCKQTYKKELT